jgi:hypothetical protein
MSLFTSTISVFDESPSLVGLVALMAGWSHFVNIRVWVWIHRPFVA